MILFHVLVFYFNSSGKDFLDVWETFSPHFQFVETDTLNPSLFKTIPQKSSQNVSEEVRKQWCWLLSNSNGYILICVNVCLWNYGVLLDQTSPILWTFLCPIWDYLNTKYAEKRVKLVKRQGKLVGRWKLPGFRQHMSPSGFI